MKKEIENINFVVRTDVDNNGSSDTYGVLQVHNVNEHGISELELNPDEIDEFIKLLEDTKELIFKQANK